MTRYALLFDLDGTLVESDPLHLKAFNSLLEKYGMPTMSEPDYRKRVQGRSNPEIMRDLFPSLPGQHIELADEKEDIFRKSLGSDVQPIHGISKLLDWAEAEGLATGVVTNAPRANMEAMLGATNLEGRFETMIVGEECERAKPDPMPYQTAMAKLKATPSQSIAFEDSGSGLRSARNAGAHVFGLTSSLAPNELVQAGAHQTIDDFTDPALWARIRTLKAN